jgi:capsular polysaccharide biosynthesis protein
MKPEPELKAIVRAGRLYARLLVVYPRHHRERYGPAMAQLFRDQCRDARRQSGLWGMMKVWARVLPDLFKTAASEHLAKLGERKSMFMKNFNSAAARTTVFWAVSASVFIFVTAASGIVTFFLPESYRSVARVKFGPRQPNQLGGVVAGYDPFLMMREVDLMTSDEVLDRVVTNLDLNSRWMAKYLMQARLQTSDSRKMLRDMIELRPVRNTSLFDITVFSDDKDEAAMIANAVAKARIDSRNEQVIELIKRGDTNGADGLVGFTVISTALPGFRPIRPNKPLNIFLGGSLGACLAIAAGGISVLIMSRNSRPPPAMA